MPKSVIAITMGDPAGVGPELALAMLNETNDWLPVVYGDEPVLRAVANRLDVRIPWETRNLSEWQSNSEVPKRPTVIHLDAISTEQFAPGEINASTGAASYRYVVAAIDDAIKARVDAVVTGPINKRAFNMAGVDFPGHTEILAERTKSDRYCMMLTSPEITCSLVTTHIGLNQVPQSISTENVFETIQLSYEALKRIRQREPQLVVCGLNPHAGEVGLFGNSEEEQIILPAVQKAQSIGMRISGPLPADTAFVPAKRKATDGYICMYHDQGLIPFKAIAFDTGVNVTLGLPIIRTSVDHGTALDIAWQGTVDLTSMKSAVDLANKLVLADGI